MVIVVGLSMMLAANRAKLTDVTGVTIGLVYSAPTRFGVPFIVGVRHNKTSDMTQNCTSYYRGYPETERI